MKLELKLQWKQIDTTENQITEVEDIEIQTAWS